MRILALETSGRSGSAALLEREGATGEVAVLDEREVDPALRTAQTLLPLVHELLSSQGWKPRELDAIAVAAGPGSFTGLRVGVVAGKSLAYALGAKLIGVNTLAAMAVQIPPADRGRLWAILDAQRQELFAAPFAGVDDLANPQAADRVTKILTTDAWLARLQPGDAVTGPPLTKLAKNLPAGVTAVAAELWPPMASAVGRLGARLLASGVESDPMALVPNYYRQSAAEEKAAASK